MPLLPRTQPELRWEQETPSKPMFFAAGHLSAQSAAGCAFVRGDSLWLAPGRIVPQTFDWPAIRVLDLANGSKRFDVVVPGLVHARIAPAGEVVALAVLAPDLALLFVDPATGSVTRRVGGIAPAPAGNVTNLEVLVAGDGTVLVGWIDHGTRETPSRTWTAGIREGRVVWRAENAWLRREARAHVMTWALEGERLVDAALANEDGRRVWTGEESEPIGLFGGAFLSRRSFTDEKTHPRYAIRAADPATGALRFHYEHENISSIAWDDHHVATLVGNGETLVILDGAGKPIVTDPKWANPAKGSPRATIAVDGAHLLWHGFDDGERAETCCSPLMDPAARMWSLPGGAHPRHTAFFDGGFVWFTDRGVEVYG